MIRFTEDLLTTLSSFGLGTVGLNLHVNTMPTTPVISTTVVTQGGFTTQGDPVRRPSFQFIHRNTNPRNGLTYITSLYHFLKNEWSSLPCAGGRFEAQSEPGAFVRDEHSQLIYSLNFVFVTSRQKL
jgi:hypothetical protein